MKNYKVMYESAHFDTNSYTIWTEDDTIRAFDKLCDRDPEIVKEFDSYEEAKAYIDKINVNGRIVSFSNLLYFEAELYSIYDSAENVLDLKASVYCEKPELVTEGEVQGKLWNLEDEINEAITYYEIYGDKIECERMNELMKLVKDTYLKAIEDETDDSEFTLSIDGKIEIAS